LKKNKISKNWINKQHRDIYVRKSKIEGYRSRAAYKIEEINTKFKIFKNQTYVVDLGAAPGSWTQYLVNNYNNCKILTVDIKNLDPIPNCNHIVGDFTEEKIKERIKKFFDRRIDVIMSDMAINTTGNKGLDSLVTGELCLDAMKFSIELLSDSGTFVSKIFMGKSFNEIIELSKKYFKKTNIFKPPASRKDSKESFIISKFLR
jgi:23S rRNA (uridine2552-2'-O)-methyltransferase|tara:strand:+ start:188 stop:799 length:612 start_codon:yes stop_codon:yes gene_type:complete